MPITLVEPYNPAWPEWFARLERLLAPALAGAHRRIEHVGSTSVPGMTAKPIIDLNIVIEPGTFAVAAAKLAALGYVHQGDGGITVREAFDLRDEALRAELPRHHLYVCAEDSAELARQIAFREYLKTHPDQAARLSRLKWELAERYDNDKAAYIAGKDALVKEITALALQASTSPPR